MPSRPGTLAAGREDQSEYQMFCAWSGPPFLVAFLYFWGMMGFNLPAPPSPALGAGELAARYVEHLGGIRVGFLVSMIVMTLYIPWTAVLSVQMMRIEGRSPVLAFIQLIGVRSRARCIDFQRLLGGSDVSPGASA